MQCSDITFADTTMPMKECLPSVPINSRIQHDEEKSLINYLCCRFWVFLDYGANERIPQFFCPLQKYLTDMYVSSKYLLTSTGWMLSNNINDYI